MSSNSDLPEVMTHRIIYEIKCFDCREKFEVDSFNPRIICDDCLPIPAPPNPIPEWLPEVAKRVRGY